MLAIVSIGMLIFAICAAYSWGKHVGRLECEHTHGDWLDEENIRKLKSK